jgi:serine-type D-Ala-D-Ala carboxypeptidase/endopeptidase
MTRGLLSFTFGTMLLAATAAAQSVQDSSVPSDSEIREILVERIDSARQSVGIVVGIIEPVGRRVVAY